MYVFIYLFAQNDSKWGRLNYMLMRITHKIFLWRQLCQNEVKYFTVYTWERERYNKTWVCFSVRSSVAVRVFPTPHWLLSSLLRRSGGVQRTLAFNDGTTHVHESNLQKAREPISQHDNHFDIILIYTPRIQHKKYNYPCRKKWFLRPCDDFRVWIGLYVQRHSVI